MGKKVYVKKFLALVLCFVLALCSMVPPALAGEVAAASVAVNGAQLIIAGLTGQKAVDELAPKFSPVVGGILDGCGVKTSTVGDTTPSQFVTTKVAQFCGAVGYSIEKFWVTIAKGCFIAQNGAIQLSHEASELVSQFGSWLFEAGEVQEAPASGGSGDGLVSFGDYQAWTLPLGVDFIMSSSIVGRITLRINEMISPVYAVQCRKGLVFFSPTSQTVRYYNKNSYGTYPNDSVNLDFQEGIYYYRNFMTIDGSENIPVYDVDVVTYLRAIGDSDPSVSVPAEDCFTGTPEVWAENKDLLNPGSASEQVTTLNPDLLNPIIDQLQAGHAYDITITQYLDALAKAFDRVADATVAVRDRVTAIEDTISIPSTATEDLTVTLDVTPATITPAVNPDDVNVDGSIDGVSYDLTRIFPFCIPFDVAAAVELFDAAPVTPHYEIHVILPHNIPFDVVIDLSDFNTVASICRKLELLLFIVGLAVVTRSLFIRS